MELQKFSEELVSLAHQAAPWVVRVNGRRGPNATGVLWSPEQVITSHRACHRDTDIEIGLAGGEIVMGRVSGRAPDYDLATISLPRPVNQEPPQWSDSGVPGLVLGLARDRGGNLLTKFGLISSEELVHRISPAPEFLGSPLVDVQGRFLGIHLMAAPPRVVGRRELEVMLSKLSEQGHIAPSFLGLGLHRVETREGYRCLVVRAEGPARPAGVQIGDHLVSIAGQSVEDPQQVREILRGLAAGSPLVLELERAGDHLQVELVLADRPEPCAPQKFKKHIRRVIRHFQPHHRPGSPPPPPGVPPEEPEFC